MAPRRRQLKWWERPLEAFAKSKPGGWIALNVANPIDQRLLEATNGKVGIFIGQQVGLLYSVGAKSGKARTTPLLYVVDGDRIVIIASATGVAKNPAWYHNVKANPGVSFLPRGGPKAQYVAHEAEGGERDRLWADANDLYAGYDEYQERAGDRRIPVVVLDPA